jgi:hypothetical protein
MPHLSDFSQLNWSFLVQQAIPALSLSLIGYLGMVGYMGIPNDFSCKLF